MKALCVSSVWLPGTEGRVGCRCVTAAGHRHVLQQVGRTQEFCLLRSDSQLTVPTAALAAAELLKSQSPECVSGIILQFV